MVREIVCILSDNLIYHLLDHVNPKSPTQPNNPTLYLICITFYNLYWTLLNVGDSLGANIMNQTRINDLRCLLYQYQCNTKSGETHKKVAVFYFNLYTQDKKGKSMSSSYNTKIFNQGTNNPAKCRNFHSRTIQISLRYWINTVQGGQTSWHF